MPIITFTTEALAPAFEFAQAKGAKDAFATGLCRLLDTMSALALNSRPVASRGEVWKDWAPASMNWALYQRVPGGGEECFYAGGLVHHGPADNGDGGAPALSVVIGRDAVTQPHLWQVHT